MYHTSVVSLADCPRMRTVDIDFVLTILLNALVPPRKESISTAGVTAKMPHMMTVVDGTSSFRAKRESPKVALHNVALLGKLACQSIFLRRSTYLESALRVVIVHVLRSCTSSVCTPFPSCIFILQHYPPRCWSSYLSVSTHVHLPITTSSSVFISTCHNHLSLPSSHYYIFLCLYLHVS